MLKSKSEETCYIPYIVYIPFIFLFFIFIDIGLTTPDYLYCRRDLNMCTIHRYRDTLFSSKTYNFPLTDLVGAMFSNYGSERGHVSNDVDLIVRQKSYKNSESFISYEYVPLFPEYDIFLINDKFYMKDQAKIIDDFIKSDQEELFIKQKMTLTIFPSFLILMYCIPFAAYLILKKILSHRVIGKNI